MAVRIERLEGYAFLVAPGGEDGGFQLVLADEPDPAKATHVLEVAFTADGKATLLRKLTGVTVVGAADMPG